MGQGSGFGPADAGLDNYFPEYPDPWAHSYLPVNALACTSNVQVPNDIYNPPERFGQAHQWISQDFGSSLVPPLSAFEAPLGPAHTPMHNNPPIAGPMASDNTVTKATETRVVFACCHEDCPFTANSKRDVRRHLNTDKHRKDHVEGLPSEDKYYCEVPNCKFANEGFSRRDNMLRHMSTIHNIELEREKRGLKLIAGREYLIPQDTGLEN
ncbi:hypothetical protein NUW58_g3011 [Xylaria curta]|uniref:Uncharacterized protein n=2 Tax=Xylaria curta TaxID=42375 RepID=A0ACC1P2X8_9PEZI|nr:hypothetical protein NUW58_g5315 [Xylaria curta]KAJ2990309.1 hypothetical protein NUW58_g3011 [Xylaria curta]